MVYLRELEAADAEQIAALEASYAPKELLVGVDFLRSELESAIRHGVNLSFGVFDDEELVGYLLAFGDDKSLFPGPLQGSVIYIEDLMVKPPYRGWLFRMFEKAGFETRVIYPGKHLEAHSLKPLIDIWKGYGERAVKLGYRLHRYEPSGEQIAGIDRYNIQWRCLDRARITAQRALDIPSHLYAQNYRWPTGHVTVNVVRDEAGWDALEPVWDDLLLRTLGHTVFQNYRYLRHWWRQLRTDEQLFIVTFSVNDVVVGIAPLQIKPARWFGQRLRGLEFIGYRSEVDRPVFMFPDHARLCMTILARFLVSRHFEWDCMSFFEQGDAALIECFDEHMENNAWQSRRRNDTVSTTIDISGNWQEYLAEKSQKFRKNLKAARKKLEAKGELVYRHTQGNTDIARVLDDHLAVEKKSWRSKKPIGMGRSPKHEIFYRELAARFDRESQFAAHQLYLDGQPIASTWGVAYDGTYYALYIAHDRDFNAFSPGTYLESLEIESSFGQGWHTYDPLGGFNSNKTRWADRSQQTYHLVVYSNRPVLWLKYLVYFVAKPRLKVITRWLRKQMTTWRAYRLPAAPAWIKTLLPR